VKKISQKYQQWCENRQKRLRNKQKLVKQKRLNGKRQRIRQRNEKQLKNQLIPTDNIYNLAQIIKVKTVVAPDFFGLADNNHRDKSRS